VSALLLSACSPASSNAQNNDVRRQLTGNQGVLLVLNNANELRDLYLPFDGAEAPIGDVERKLPNDPRFNPGGSGGAGSGIVQVGELNLLIHNVGQSATAGGIFVSGYDPNLVTVRSRLGEDQINSARPEQTCLQNVIVDNNQYDVLLFCERNDGVSYGFQIEKNGDRESQTVTIGGLPLDKYADEILSAVTGENVGWFTRNGFFGTNGRVILSNADGRQGVRIVFGNPSGDPNRALRGFLLLNMLYGEIKGCSENCRVFPPRFATGQVLLGVSDESPQGDALFYNYDIIVDRSKWPVQINDLPQTFQVTACYYYTTTLTPTVCVDPDPANNRGDPCTTSPVVYKQSQGAPIAVTRIDSKSVPGGTLFTISLRHVGNGRFFEPGSLPMCGPYSGARPDPRRFDTVYLLDARMAGEPQKLRCSPRNENGQVALRFQNGVAQVSCVYSSALPVRQAYESALSLEFGYLYQNTIAVKTIIHRT
jgi:hypothetical protein